MNVALSWMLAAVVFSILYGAVIALIMNAYALYYERTLLPLAENLRIMFFWWIFAGTIAGGMIRCRHCVATTGFFQDLVDGMGVRYAATNYRLNLSHRQW